MYGRVTDDASAEGMVWSAWRRLGFRAAIGCMTLLGWWSGPRASLAQTPAQAAQNQVQPGKLVTTFREVETKKEWIHIPQNKSVLIETNVPITRQQTLAPDIAEIASVSPTQALVTGKSLGRTQVIIWSGEDRKVYDISVELELDALKEAMRRVDPLAKADAYSIGDLVVLTGTVSDADSAARMMEVASIFATNIKNHMQVAGEQQVMLRCTVAEVTRSALRQLGVNFILGGENFRDFPLVSNIGGVNPSSFGLGAGAITRNLPFVTNGTAVAGGTTLSFGLPRGQLQAFLRALNENGFLRVLAEPNLVTISGKSAGFLAGGEFPVPVPRSIAGEGESSTITIEYKEFGVRLSFTPVVLANQMIRLNVAPEVSDLDFASGVNFGGFVVPGLSSRRAETTVEMGSGQSLAIAGLLSENVRSLSSRLPGIGQVPILGALFASTEYRKNMTELVIVVSPEIVAPMNPDQLGALPGEGLADPNDWQLFALGILETKTVEDAGAETEAEPADAALQTPNYLDPSASVSLFGPWGQSDYEESN